MVSLTSYHAQCDYYWQWKWQNLSQHQKSVQLLSQVPMFLSCPPLFFLPLSPLIHQLFALCMSGSIALPITVSPLPTQSSIIGPVVGRCGWSHVSLVASMMADVQVFVGCCLATKSLKLNNTKWNGWGVAAGC